MSAEPEPKSLASALREAFDFSFAEAPSVASEHVEHVLTLRMHGDPYAMRLRDIAGIMSRPNIVRVPAQAPGLLGLTGLRGEIVPVFGLAALLGEREERSSPAWMVLCGTTEPVGLAFSEFEGYLRLSKAVFHLDDNPGAAGLHLNELLVTDQGSRPVIAISRVVASLRQRGRGLSIKEP